MADGGGTSNRPDLSDPMGAPKFVTGTEYMDALGRLGYNINDPGGLSTMFDIAQKGTNLLDSVYKQNMAVQTANADLAYKYAQAGYLDSETDYNQKSLDARIEDLKSQARLRDAQGNNQLSEAKSRDAITTQNLKVNQFNLDEDAKKISSRDAGIEDLNSMGQELDDLSNNHLHDPDFEALINGIVNKHRAVQMDLTGTSQQLAQQKIETIRRMRYGSTLADIYANQRSSIDDLVGGNYLKADPTYSARIGRGEGPDIMAEGNTNKAIDRLQTIQARARDLNQPNSQAIIDQAAAEIRQLQQSRIPQQAYTGGDQAQMMVPPMTKPNGTLNENTEGLIQGLETATGLRAPAAAATAKGSKIVQTWEPDLERDPSGKTLKLKTYVQTDEDAPAPTAAPPGTAQTAPGRPATPQDVIAQTNAMLADPRYQTVMQQYDAGNILGAPPGSLDSNNPAEKQAALNAIKDSYRKLKAAAGEPIPGQTPQNQTATQTGQTAVPTVVPQNQGGAVASAARQEAEAEADRRLGPERAGLAAEAARKAAAGEKVSRVEDQAMQERERIIQGQLAPAKPGKTTAPPKPIVAPQVGRRGGAAAGPASSAGMSDDEMERFVSNPQVTSDPRWGQMSADAASGDNPLPGGVSPFTPEGRHALIDRYLQETGGQAGQTQVAQAQLPPTAPARPDQTVPTHIATQTQVQNAPAPVLVVNDPAKVDYHTFKFGNASTFGLNYDGTRDWEDDGQGFYANPVTGRPYNTRDPGLIGASVPTADLVAKFGPEATRPNSGLSKMIARGDIQVQVAQPNGGVVQMPLVDQGPAKRTGATLDLTHAASRLFLTQGKRVLGYRFVDRYGNPFTG